MGVEFMSVEATRRRGNEREARSVEASVEAKRRGKEKRREETALGERVLDGQAILATV